MFNSTINTFRKGDLIILAFKRGVVRAEVPLTVVHFGNGLKRGKCVNEKVPAKQVFPPYNFDSVTHLSDAFEGVLPFT